MRIFDLHGLPSELRPQLAGMNPLLGDPPQDLAFIERLRRFHFPASDYYGVYAVEHGEILSRIETLWLTLTTERGPETVVGISDVLTRPDAIGQGYAGSLLEEVHRREIALGRRWSLLWTHRSWGAHHLYERLGYRDIYSPPVALRWIPAPARSVPDGYRWTTARPGDLARLEEILARGTRDRLGLVPRFPGSFRTRVRFGWRRTRDHRILWHGSVPIGYGHFSGSTRRHLGANEVVVVSPRHARPMLLAMESIAARRWLTISYTSFARDIEPVLRERGYAIHPKMHLTLMAKALGARHERTTPLERLARDPRFSCHRGDVF